MKMWASIALILALSLAGWAAQSSGAQTSSSSQASQNNQSGQAQTDQSTQSNPNQTTSSQTSAGSANQGQNMSGSVGKGGKTFTNSANNQTYKVDNPDTLQGSEGDNVSVIVHVDPDTGMIHVIQLVPSPR